MIIFLALYLTGMVVAVLVVDRRLHAGQRQREAAHFQRSTGLLL